MDFSDLSARAAESNLVFRSSFSCGFCFPCKLEFYLHESVFEWRRRNHVLSAVVLLVVFRSQAVPRQPMPKGRLRASALSPEIRISASASLVPSASLARIGGSCTSNPCSRIPSDSHVNEFGRYRLVRKVHFCPRCGDFPWKSEPSEMH